MNRRPLALSLCIVLLMVSSCDSDGGWHEEGDYSYGTVTPTPDYDYDATFDYYYVTQALTISDSTAGHKQRDTNKASAIGQLSPMLLLGLAVWQMWV